MADWRQIQARIRKAKAAPEPAAQLSELFERTRDGMVAFELAKVHEKAGATPEAVQWYTTAAERFRRPQWRTRAEEALTRLGAPIPPRSEAAPATAARAVEGEGAGEAAERMEPAPAYESQLELIPSASDEPPTPAPSGEAATQPAAGGELGEASRRRRHRGRRGGRGRRRGKTQTSGEVAPVAPQAAELPAVETPSRVEKLPAPRHLGRGRASRGNEGPLRPPPVKEIPEREPSIESPPGPVGWQVKGRPGDPGLSSRMAQLESQLRRLLASPLYKMEDADHAPAGPGVFLVTDSDQTSYYHVEACQTLRIGIANQLRADRRAPKGTESLKSKFADHLGITEPRVAKYLNDHCAVRWLQLDDGAPLLAHFAIAVLRPILDET